MLLLTQNSLYYISNVKLLYLYQQYHTVDSLLVIIICLSIVV